MPVDRHQIEVRQHQQLDGDQTSIHHHDRHQLTYAASGALTVVIASARWVVPPLRAVWIRAGVEHRIRVHGSTNTQLVFVDPDFTAQSLSRVAVVGVNPLLKALISGFNRAAERSETERHHIEALLLLQLERLASRPLQLPTLRDPRLAVIQDALEKQPDDRRTLREWGQLCGASERTLSRLFASEIGTTFGRWRTQLRLQHALILLAQGSNVTTTAHACGYRSTSAFIESFVSVLGTTPGRFFDQADGLAEAAKPNPRRGAVSALSAVQLRITRR